MLLVAVEFKTAPEKTRAENGSQQDDAAAGRAGQPEVGGRWGRYRIDVSRIDGAPVASSVTFNAGWYQSDDDADSPEMLSVALDKDAYKGGETAKLKMVGKIDKSKVKEIAETKMKDLNAVDIEGAMHIVETHLDNALKTLTTPDQEIVARRAGHVDVVMGTHNVHRAAELLAESRPASSRWDTGVEFGCPGARYVLSPQIS